MVILRRKSASFDIKRDVFTSRSYQYDAFFKLSKVNRSMELGFSMLEMLMVLAIVSILSTLAIPRFQTISDQSDVDVVAREMMQQMEAARIYAQANQVKVTACPVALNNLNDSNPKCLSSNTPNNWQAWIWYAGEWDDNRILMRSSYVSASVSFTSTKSLIVFDSKGNAIGSNQTLTATSNNAHTGINVILAQTGRVRTEKSPLHALSAVSATGFTGAASTGITKETDTAVSQGLTN